MILKSFGCSFTFGTDLSDSKKNYDWSGDFSGSSLTWPALLARKLNYNYKCYAKPGSGNLQILEKLLNELCVKESAVYVINWSWIDRLDYEVEKSWWPGTPWETITPGDTKKISKYYYKNLHSQYRDKLTTLIYIQLAINALQSHGYKFIMTCIDNLVFETEWHTTPAVLEMQNYIRPYIVNFENKTFLDYSKEKGFPISETLHPLEDAHQAAFEIIKNYNLV